jgi:hypothetical protein
VSPALAPAPGVMLARLEALAAELAARGRRAALVTRPGCLPCLDIPAGPGRPGDQVCALPRRDSTRAYWRPGLRSLAARAADAADIIAGPRAQLPAAAPRRDKTGPEAAA